MKIRIICERLKSLVFVIFLALQISVLAQEEAEEKENFIAHEWGVFAVDMRNNFIQIGMPVTQEQKRGDIRALKPIIYFYSQEPLSVKVRVKFPYGNPGRTLPQAELLGNELKWKVKVLEGKENVEENELNKKDKTPKEEMTERIRRIPPRLPQSITNEDWVEMARDVKANTIKVNMQKEKFLFYDGWIRNYKFNVSMEEDKTSKTGTVFSIDNESEYPAYDILIIKKDDDQYEIGTLENLKSEKSVKVKTEVIKEKDFQKKGSKMLEEALTKAGLYKDEAKSVAEIWKEKFFDEEKDSYTYLIYRMPEEEYNKLLPIKINPIPKELKRIGLVWVQQQ